MKKNSVLAATVATLSMALLASCGDGASKKTDGGEEPATGDVLFALSLEACSALEERLHPAVRLPRAYEGSPVKDVGNFIIVNVLSSRQITGETGNGDRIRAIDGSGFASDAVCCVPADEGNGYLGFRTDCDYDFRDYVEMRKVFMRAGYPCGEETLCICADAEAEWGRVWWVMQNACRAGVFDVCCLVSPVEGGGIFRLLPLIDGPGPGEEINPEDVIAADDGRETPPRIVCARLVVYADGGIAFGKDCLVKKDCPFNRTLGPDNAGYAAQRRVEALVKELKELQADCTKQGKELIIRMAAASAAPCQRVLDIISAMKTAGIKSVIYELDDPEDA